MSSPSPYGAKSFDGGGGTWDWVSQVWEERLKNLQSCLGSSCWRSGLGLWEDADAACRWGRRQWLDMLCPLSTMYQEPWNATTNSIQGWGAGGLGGIIVGEKGGWAQSKGERGRKQNQNKHHIHLKWACKPKSKDTNLMLRNTANKANDQARILLYTETNITEWPNKDFKISWIREITRNYKTNKVKIIPDLFFLRVN